MTLRSATSLFVLALATGCGADTTATGDEEHLIELDPKLEAAARDNLKRIAMEIDAAHMQNYKAPSGALPPNTDATFPDKIAAAFLNAVKLEYQAKPDLLKRRVETLASMVFFSAPEVKTDASIGRVTPFHGLDDTGFEKLMSNEDVVFNSHMQQNGGSPNGVRPFSVCETKYLIDISTGKVQAGFVQDNVVTNYDDYAQAYQTYAGTCVEADLLEWYNFRGLGGLRPSWLESNYNDRVLRNMLKRCKADPIAAGDQAPCEAFKQDRLAYRDGKNIAMALREMVFDTATESRIGDQQDGDYISDPNNAGVFLEDQNGDGVAEWLTPGSVNLKPGAVIKIDGSNSLTVSADGASVLKSDGSTQAVTSAMLSIVSTAQFSGDLNLQLALADNSTMALKPGFSAFQPVTRVMPGWQASFTTQADLGLQTLLSDGDCSGDRADPATCPLVKRFYSMIDRHENFYQTYSAFDGSRPSVSSQPSPLVACSITLRASHKWDNAGTPAGGSAGFIYLMRIPFNQILVGDVRSIDTLGRLKGDLKAGPEVIKLQDVIAGAAHLDMSKLWLDIATLSNNQYSSEHEVSKFGTVPASQIEGVLVVRRPAAMGTTH